MSALDEMSRFDGSQIRETGRGGVSGLNDRLQILIIDDDDVDRLAIRRALRGMDAEITEAKDGDRGISLLMTERFDCAFLDFRLPPVDGLAVLKEALAAGVGIPIIILTGQGDEKLAGDLLRAGAADYLSKATLCPEMLSRSIQYVKQVHQTGEALRRLASFPQLAPDPIIEVSLAGEITYLNPAASELFPSMAVDGLRHPMLRGWEGVTQSMTGDKVLTREVLVDKDYYHQTISKVGLQQRLRIYATSITERKRAEQQLLHSAFYDALTDLPNRALFVDRLGRGLKHYRRHGGKGFAVLFLDLDRFKNVNDSLGHLRGDQLLVAASERLLRCVRTGDTVARFGGDEFAVYVDAPEDMADVTRIAERIQKEFEQPFKLGEREVFATASIGIALSKSGYKDSEELLRDADTAMYRAKGRGGARFQVFDTEMHAHAVAMLQMETELRLALERDELRLYFQPIVSLASGRLAGFETLVRWEHPQRGLVTPDVFIPLAEEIGIIVELGEWALHAACRQMSVWRDHSKAQTRPLRIGVNVSSRQFAQGDLVGQIRRNVSEAGLSSGPITLTLEITETTIMEHLGEAAEILALLKPLGVQVSVDDFGTGYSSLAYLRRLPIDTLKIDHTFVQGRGNHEIVRAIIALARNLGLQVVAEGIESREQCDLVRGLQCDYGQGFLFGRAVSEPAATGLITADHQWFPFEGAVGGSC